MALIVITVQDTDTGAVVSLASEPAMSMATGPVGEAQTLAQLMLSALPVNPPVEPEPAVPITAAMVTALRDKTDASMLTCKKALEKANGDIDKAEELIRTGRPW